jgi:hypothetical protein
MIDAAVLDEPDLIFGGRREEKDPRLGLRQFGPYYSEDEGRPSPSLVRVGIVGTGVTLTLAEEVLKALGNPIPSEHFNKWAHPDYDGFSLENQVRCKFVTADAWNASIPSQDIQRIIQIRNPNERIASAVRLFIFKLEQIAAEESPPDVVIFALPQPIVDYCGISEFTRGAKKPRFTPRERLIAELKEKNQRFLEDWGLEISEHSAPREERDYDFRNAIKGKVMPIGIPVQILKEETGRKFLDGSGESDGSLIRASFAWNFSTGLYYKAKGKPWRLARLAQGTCYVGVSFYRDLRSPRLDLQTSMAQIFTHSGDGFVLRGDEVIVEPGSKEAHLSRKQAQDLLTSTLAIYSQKASALPSRVVIHKTSRFSVAEREGFLDALKSLPYDFVTISNQAPLKLLRMGAYPVLRGTVVRLSDAEFCLYTSGYVSRLRTYPGRRVPGPLFVIHEGSSQPRIIANEILGLTKLNWNTTTFATRMPITLEFAHQVGKVLSELERGAPLQDHYRFYM